MVDVLELQGSIDHLLLEDGSGRLALESIRQTWKVASSVSAATLVITTTEDIPVGSTVIIGSSRSTGAGITNGLSSISDPSGNTWSINDAESGRTSTFDVSISHCLVTTLIPAGSAITLTWANSTTRRSAVGAVWADLVGTLDQTSGNNSGGDGATSVGANGSSATPTATTSGATTVPDEVVVGIGSYGGTSDEPTPGAGFTGIGAIRTTAGSSDRGLIMEYKVISATGVQTATTTNDVSGGWAAAVATYPINLGVPAPVFNKGAFFALL